MNTHPVDIDNLVRAVAESILNAYESPDGTVKFRALHRKLAATEAAIADHFARPGEEIGMLKIYRRRDEILKEQSARRDT